MTGEMITIKRPGFGIKPKLKKKLVGKVALRDIVRDEWITWDIVK
ncbi:MAG: SAF domain-containing protein [Candidatus Omnitrophota bacterium]